MRVTGDAKICAPKMGRALFAVPVKAPIPLSDSITLPNRTSMSRQMKMQAGNWVCDSIRYDPIPTRVGGCGWRGGFSGYELGASGRYRYWLFVLLLVSKALARHHLSGLARDLHVRVDYVYRYQYEYMYEPTHCHLFYTFYLRSRSLHVHVPAVHVPSLLRSL